MRYAEAGFNTGAVGRNWKSYEGFVGGHEGLREWQRNFLMDPQTSGGLLVSCDPQAQGDVLAMFHDRGYTHATVVGKLTSGDPRVRVV